MVGSALPGPGTLFARSGPSAASASPRVRYNPKSAEPDPDSEAKRAASGVPAAARRRLISAREGCWGKTTRSKSFSIQLMIPVRTSADSIAVRPGLLPRRRHRRSLLQTRPRESLPERRWRRHGSTSLVYRYLPPRSNLPRRRARPSRERPAAWRRRSPARRPRTRSARCRASG